ncbi:MAG TPA: hypothetical protein VGC95_02130 [Chitinophagaceae bacterium]
MEKLLDVHLPRQKDDRRRWALILLLLAFFGGTGYLLVAKPWRHPLASAVPLDMNTQRQPSTPSVAKDANANGAEKQSTPTVAGGQASTPASITANSHPSPAGQETAVSRVRARDLGQERGGGLADSRSAAGSQQGSKAAVNSRSGRPATSPNRITVRSVKNNSTSDQSVVDKSMGDKPVTSKGVNSSTGNSTSNKQSTGNAVTTNQSTANSTTKNQLTASSTTNKPSGNTSRTANNSTADANSPQTQGNSQPASSQVNQPPAAVNQVPKKSGDEKPATAIVNAKPLVATDSANRTAAGRKPGRKVSRFGIFFSTGPDVSKARDSRTGKTTVLYGAGASYTTKRFSLRTGLFASDKIYWAGPKDYKLSLSPPSPTTFEGADANCHVLEIPLKLSYMFANTDRSNWFASTGISSYLMKKEKYVFSYKTASSWYYYPYEIRNENKHMFSILTFSAGYTRRFGDRVSMTAEPYAEIPMTGIGTGKVHLTSGGVLFSIGINPF